MSEKTNQMEIKKMKQGMSYSCKEKIIILNVFKYFRQQFPEKCVTEIVRRTSRATGCSEKSIFQFRKEESSAEGFKIPSKTKIRKNININSRDIKYDSTVRQSIRNIIQDLKNKHIMPSLNAILSQVKADSMMPNFSLMTLRRLLFDMGFCYEKQGSKLVLVDKQNETDSSNLHLNIEKKKLIKEPIIQQITPLSQTPQKENGNSLLTELVQHQSTYMAPPVLNDQKIMYVPHSGTYVMPPPQIHESYKVSMDMKRKINPQIEAMPTNLPLKREVSPWIPTW